jgi:hypothetical protein
VLDVVLDRGPQEQPAMCDKTHVAGAKRARRGAADGRHDEDGHPKKYP